MTLRDVAARAGVSASTASLAYAQDPRVTPATRERVLAAAQALGYSGPDPLARSLRSGRTGVVGAVVGERLGYAFADPHAVAVLDGLAAELEPFGGALLLLGGGRDEGARVAQVSTVPMDAAVYVTCGAPADPALEVLLARGVPVVGIEGPAVRGVHLIDIDNRGASADLARYVTAAGHRRVAVVTMPWLLDGTRGPLPEQRRQVPGYADVAARLAGVEDVLTPVSVVEVASNQRSEGAHAARTLLTGPDGTLREPAARPTAVIAQSDLLAVGVVEAVRALGLRVPEDVSVAGFDGIETPWLGDLQLTTVVQSGQEKGRAAGRLVAGLLRGDVNGRDQAGQDQAGRDEAGRDEPVLLPVTLRRGMSVGPSPE